MKTQTIHSRGYRLAWWLILLVGSALTRVGSATAGQAVDYPVFLPLIMRPPVGIRGTVTEGGLPAEGAGIDLRRANPIGGTYPLVGHVNTDANGQYLFPNLPSLGPGEYYWIQFNGADPNRLLWWRAPNVTVYTANTLVQLDTFDIAGLTQVAPAPDAHVNLPYTFQWNLRPATPQDSYSVSFSGPGGIWSGYLGYVDSYYLQALGSGARTGGYYWYVRVMAPNGGGGVQYGDRRVYFDSLALADLPILERFFGLGR